MSSVGGFREGEIDGKSFLIFTLLGQQDNPPSSSNEKTTLSEGNNDLLQPLFMCPMLRILAACSKRKENGYNSDDTLIPINTLPHFPTSTSGGDRQVQDFLDSNSHNICKLPIAPLFWCNNHESSTKKFRCDACLHSKHHGTNYYFCASCDGKYHKECVESPSEIKYPLYPFLSFQLFYTMAEDNFLECFCCKSNLEGMTYSCPTSKLSMHPVCAKQAFLPCNVCGLIKEFIPTYLCLSCVFVVHHDCVYFPVVIKISRHHHRVSFTSSLPCGEWSCGVCRKEVDNNYGAYSCNKCNAYFVHTRCALREDLWDGEELEGVPEEPELVVEPFKTIDDGIILHFSHDHLLKLEINKVYNEDKFCSACILPVIFEDEFYSCMNQCDFILHGACANAPRKKHHPSHAHPLKLKVVTNGYNGYGDNQGYFQCDACSRDCCGFVYESVQRGSAFTLDLRCALVSEPFEYQGHEDPLFLALTPEEQDSAICQICQDTTVGSQKLNCIKCDYIICFKCATLPYKTRYKHDSHLLTFRKEKEASDRSGWCELCERELVYSQDGGFYSCDDCCTTLNVDCLLGRDTHMRPGQTITLYREEGIHILDNNTMSRPFCHYKNCREGRCPYRLVFRKENRTFCSYFCAYYS